MLEEMCPNGIETAKLADVSAQCDDCYREYLGTIKNLPDDAELPPIPGNFTGSAELTKDKYSGGIFLLSGPLVKKCDDHHHEHSHSDHCTFTASINGSQIGKFRISSMAVQVHIYA